MPIPPKDAWLIPPLIKTIRLETMYVPMIPQDILARIAANNEFTKRLYSKKSNIVFSVTLQYPVRYFSMGDYIYRAVIIF